MNEVLLRHIITRKEVYHRHTIKYGQTDSFRFQIVPFVEVIWNEIISFPILGRKFKNMGYTNNNILNKRSKKKRKLFTCV